MSAFKDTEKTLSSTTRAFQAFQTVANGAKGSISSVVSAFSALSTAQQGILVGTALVGAAAAAVVAIYDQYQQSLLEAVEAADEASTTWDEQRSSLSDYVERIDELKTALSDGTLTEDEAYEAKSELLEIQNALNDTYGDAAAGIDLVNGDLQEQLDLLNELNKAWADQYLNENNKGIEEATKQMEKLRNYTTIFSAGSKTAMDALEDLLTQHEDFSLFSNDDGTYTLTFTGDATQAYEEMNGLASGIRALEDEYGENDVFDSLIEYATGSLSGINEILETYQNTYEEAHLAELIRDTTTLEDLLSDGVKLPNDDIETYSDLYEAYAEAVENYNEALESGDASKISDAKDQFEAVDTVVQDLMSSDSLGGYDDLFLEVADSLDTASIAAQDFNNALSNGDYKEALEEIDSWSEEEKEFQIALLVDGSDEASASLTEVMDKAYDLGLVSKENGTYTEDSINTILSLLQSLGYITIEVTEDAALSVSDLETAFASAEETVEGLTTAMSESASATGLSADSITLVESAFEGLDDYDAAALFETTANGVHLNKQELERLNDEYREQEAAKYADTLAELNDELNDAQLALEAAGDDQEALNAALSDISSIESQIQEVKLLQAQYEGLTSAYNDFLSAQSATDERDAYETLGDSYETIEQLINLGWVSDSEVTEYLDLLLAADERTQDNYADFQKLKKTIEGTSYSIADFFQYDEDGNLTSVGLYNMLDAVRDKLGEEYVTVDDNGVYSFDWSADKIYDVADALGMSEEAVELLVRAMIEAGFDVIFEDAADSASTLADEIQEAKDAIAATTDTTQDAVDALREMGELENFTFNLDAELDGVGGISEQLAAAKASLLNENGEIKFEADTEEYQNALIVLTALTQKQQELENADRAVMQVDVSQANSDVGELVRNVQGLQTEFDNYELNLIIGADTTEGQKQIVEYAGEVQKQLEELDEQTIVDLGLDDDEFQAAIARVSGTDIEAGATVSQEDIDIIENTINGIGEDALITVGLAEGTETAEETLEDIRTTVETLNTISDVNITVTITINGKEELDGIIEGMERVAEFSDTQQTASGVVEWTNDTGEVEEYTEVEKESSGTVIWTNDSALIDKYIKQMKYANGTVLWTNDISKVKTKFTATGTVSWSNSGTANVNGTAYSMGSAFLGGTHGDWGVKGSGVGLIGEVGPEILVSKLVPPCPVMGIDNFI